MPILDENMLLESEIGFDCPDEAEDKEQKSGRSSLTTSPSNPVALNKKRLDDDEETFDIIYDNLPQNISVLKDCIHKAQGCCLLLILKLFLKEVYSISER